MRIDKTLWFLRFVKTRSQAQSLVEQGHIRLNGRRIARSSTITKPGDVLVLPLAHGIQIVEILALPQRRGPTEEAQQCYRVLDEHGANTIAANPERPDIQGEPPK